MVVRIAMGEIIMMVGMADDAEAHSDGTDGG